MTLTIVERSEKIKASWTYSFFLLFSSLCPSCGINPFALPPPCPRHLSHICICISPLPSSKAVRHRHYIYSVHIILQPRLERSMSRGYDHEGYFPVMDDNTCGTDGALDRVLGFGQKQLKCVPAIFIHAGAGFHSHQNEHVHLQACVA